MSVPAAPRDPVAEIAGTDPGAQVGAFFDLDGTLLAGFTATAHAGDRIRRRQARAGEVLGVVEAAVRYRLGRMQFEKLLARAAGYLRGESLADLDVIGERLFAAHHAGRIYPLMRQIVAAHQARGHTVVLSSSALTIHAEPVAKFLGVEAVLCNHFEVDAAGVLTGGIVAPVVWGPQKAGAVERFCAEHRIALADTFFYADGDEDAALMTRVGHPRPVNPRPGLAALAGAHGWPVLRVAEAARPRNRSPRAAAGSLRAATRFGLAVLRAITTR